MEKTVKKDKVSRISKIKKPEISTTEKINIFFKKNNYLIVVALSGMMLLTMCDNRSYKKQMQTELEKNTQYLKQNIQTIGFVTATGMLLTIDRKPINYNDDRIKQAIVNLTIEPFLQGNEEIKAGKNYSSADEMVENNKKFSHFYNHLVKDKQSVHKLLGAIYETSSALYYPEHITLLEEEIVHFNAAASVKHKDRIDFHASVACKLRTKSWIVQLNKWYDQDIALNINISGEIDPVEYASSDNLLGFKVTNIDLPLIQKPDISYLKSN